MAACPGSGARIQTTPGQRFMTAGARRPNEAREVRCPGCGRVFDRARIVHTDHGIPSPNRAVVPRHNAA